MISIITITFNNPDELKKTLKSIPNKDFIESAVINGGDSKETIDYLKNYPGIVINERDSGIADAFNKGIKNSSGEFIMFLNSGDLLTDPEYPKEANSILLNDDKIEFVHSNILFKDLTGAEIIMKPTFSNLGRGMPYLHPTMIVRRKIFNEIGLFNLDYKIAMDFDFIVRLQKKEYNGYYIEKDPVVIMGGTGKSALDEWKAIKECYSSLKKNNSFSIKNMLGMKIRISLYLFRRILIALGLKDVLKKLKEKKYSSA
jgi:glycosyltransferase involved in cell wall biosynthesis